MGRPNLPSTEALFARLRGVLERRWLTNDGSEVRDFEARIAELCGVRNCVAVCNGTIALEIAIRAAGLTGEVIVPSFTFVATAHALQWLGITPVFCDIDETYCLDPRRVEELISPRTSGILGVHLWGRTCNVEALEEICRSRQLKLIFDAAHAFQCSRNGRMVGGFGCAEVFSFHATKFLNTAEGGAVLTNDDAFAESCRRLRNFGFAGEDKVLSIGTNGKMSELHASMGIASLEKLPEFIAANQRNYAEYAAALASVPGFNLLPYDAHESNNYQYVVVDVDERSGLDRDQWHALLHAENLMARRYFYPGCHRMEPYRTLYSDAGLRLPRTEHACSRILCLPTGTAVGPDEIRDTCELLSFAAHNAAELRSRWPLPMPGAETQW
ncbi:MAG: DegT/DnrJ/EryC1/StrS family aminotransferase [Terracidiphilus sp.]